MQTAHDVECFQLAYRVFLGMSWWNWSLPLFSDLDRPFISTNITWDPTALLADELSHLRKLQGRTLLFILMHLMKDDIRGLYPAQVRPLPLLLIARGDTLITLPPRCRMPIWLQLLNFALFSSNITYLQICNQPLWRRDLDALTKSQPVPYWINEQMRNRLTKLLMIGFLARDTLHCKPYKSMDDDRLTLESLGLAYGPLAPGNPWDDAEMIQYGRDELLWKLQAAHCRNARVFLLSMVELSTPCHMMLKTHELQFEGNSLLATPYKQPTIGWKHLLDTLEQRDILDSQIDVEWIQWVSRNGPLFRQNLV